MRGSERAMRTTLCVMAAVALLACLGAGPASGFTVETILGNGDTVDHLDLVVVGDGYTASEQGLLSEDAQNFVSQFFMEEPYASYKGRFNVWLVHVESAQSGADKSDAVSDATCIWALVQVDTALNCSYCCNATQRLLCCDSSTVWAVLDEAVPEWDLGVVLVNSTVYGGSGGTVSVFSRNEAVGYLAQHEIAHTMAALADEYEACYMGYSQDFDSPNITRYSSREWVSWKDLIDQATPVPTFRHLNCNGVESGSCGADLSDRASNCMDAAGTPASDDYWIAHVNEVGLFEGGRYMHTPNYRPAMDCKMRSTAPFCPVCSRTIISWIKYYAPDPPVDVCDGIDNNGDGTIDEEAACDDGNDCTDDACDSVAGTCVFVADNSNACTDSNACTAVDACVAGVCVSSPPTGCDDGNECTDDTCDPATGCAHTPNSGACDDGNLCTLNGCGMGECLLLGTIPGCCQQQTECKPQLEKCDAYTHQCTYLPCLKCMTDADCGGEGALCTAFATSNYCTLPCGGEAGSCPTDYQCDLALDPPMCVPVQGDCVCVPDVFVVCHDHALFFTGSCGEAGAMVDDCGSRGCAGSECCPYESHQEGTVCVPDGGVEVPDIVEEYDAGDGHEGDCDVAGSDVAGSDGMGSDAGDSLEDDIGHGDLGDLKDWADPLPDVAKDMADLQAETVTDSGRELPGADVGPESASPETAHDMETAGDGATPGMDVQADTGNPGGSSSTHTGGCEAATDGSRAQSTWALWCLLGLLVGVTAMARRASHRD